MRSLRTFALKTQWAIIAAFMTVFVFGVSLSHWYKSDAQARMSSAFHVDLAVATKLPRLKTLLRNLDLITFQYLQTGKEEWLAEHEKTLGRIQAVQRDLSKLLPRKREQTILKELDRRLAQHFLQESRWIGLKKAGKLSVEETARILAERRSYDEILEIALNMHDIDIREFPERRKEADRAARWAVLAILALGLLASGLSAYVLSTYIIRPVRVLSEYSSRWRLGEPWRCEVPSVSPEIKGLFIRMKELMESLNEEYRKARETDGLKTKLVATVSHELNNAISVIHAASATLEMGEPEPRDEKRDKMYRMIKGQSRSISTTVANLLNVGRLESGKLALAKTRMDMGNLLRKSLDLMEILYENKELRVSTSLPDVAIPVHADPDALTLVVTNLISNAIKYTPKGGTISVGLAKDDKFPGFIRVYVRDSGIGIDPAEKERIFSGYYRSERGKKLAKGFGIGLSLVKTIIEAHGGRLELESEPDKGSTFSFLLPVWIPNFTTKRDGQRKERLASGGVAPAGVAAGPAARALRAEES